MYNTCTMYDTVYLLVVPGGFHNTRIKFHFDVQNNNYYQRMFTLKEFHANQSGTTFCSIMIDRARLGYTQAVRFHPTHDMMPAIAIDECTHSPKNGVSE